MTGDRTTVVFQGRRHRDLLLDPTADDVELAVAFERGEISAFEYQDGHTYPPNREIGSRNRRDAM
jgi:hypothetical protein